MKRLDEILEECITAGLEGRRTVEESLDLYQAVAVELEPLLRTALGVSDTFQSYNPPAGAEQPGLSRFLADAAARRRLRDLATGFEDRGWFGRLWRRPVFAGFAAGAAVLVLVAAVTAGALNMGGGSDDNGTGGSAVTQPTSQPSHPTLVSDLRSRVDSANEKLDSGGQLETADLQEISALIAQLNGVSIEDFREELEAMLPATYEILTGGANGPPAGSDDPAVQDAINTTRDLADALGLKLPDPLAGGTAKTPAPTPVTTEQPTAAATAAPTAPPSTGATPAPTPTPSPTPAPTPSATADSRDPPGFLP